MSNRLHSGSVMTPMDIISLLRVKQWYKNVLVFVGIIFSLNFFNFSMWFDVILAFFAFCMLSSSAYIINDVLDFNKDKIHPIKCQRPIPSGKISIKNGIVISCILLIVGLIIAFCINFQFFLISILFLGLTNIYSFYLKQFVIIDAIVIGINFVIRATAGCIAIKVPISPWITLCALLLALFLVFGKRRHELTILQSEANNHRNSLKEYSIETIDEMISITASALLISYSLYTFFTEHRWMMITIPIIMYGLFRYILLVHSKNMGGEPELILIDKGILFSVLGWTFLSVIILYNIPEITVKLLGFT